MFDTAQTFTLPGNPPQIITWSDPFFDVVQATVGSTPLATGGTITFQYPAARAPASYLGASLETPALFVRAMQALLVAETDFTLAFGATSVTLTYLSGTTIPAGSILSLQLPVTNTSGQDHVRGHAIPITAIDPNLGL